MDPRFACLKLDASAVLPTLGWIEEATSLQAMVDGTANAFILDGSDPDYALRAVELIRRTPHTFAAPVFCTKTQGARVSSLADGLILDAEDALPKAQEILSAAEELDASAPLRNADFRLLGWLYTRKNSELVPVPDPLTAGIYGYPPAECFAEDKTDVYRWIQSLQDQGQIVPVRLVSRIRTCPRCGASHMNYIDVCPVCKSINIASAELVHCFTCGHVAPMDEFIRGDSLYCSHCRATLRHLGSDYDNPLESMVCSDCGNRFVEPIVVASCYGCESLSLPEELSIRSFHTWRITDKGRLSARVGEMEVAYALFDKLGNVTSAYFEQFLNWSIHYARRYQGQTFTLLGLRFINLEEIADALGNHRMSQLLDSMVSRLKELLRTTDVTSRSSVGTLWFLLPQTSGEQGKCVQKRIEQLKELVQLDKGPCLEMKIALFAFPDDFRKNDMSDSTGAKDLLFELNARLEEE